MMRRRSCRSKPVSMLGAFLIEAGTMLAFIALAQPTWTRNLIEQVTTLPVPSTTSSAPNSTTNPIQPTSLQSTLTQQAERPVPSQQFVAAEYATSFMSDSHQALRPIRSQPATLAPLAAPSLLNTPAPSWGTSAWNNNAGVSTVARNPGVNNNASAQGWQPSSVPTNSSPSPPWSDTTERVAQASWSASRLPAAEVRFAPQYPVYPPSNWSNSY